ncbi:hypothetical protein GE061_015748 [Apolygus lucorum]|uniref:Uncharacterized protein n=1 Tax=Apolygus lucorum TaxID=248454 RepID=A0A8S9XM26_APOLU|nr:hypothetical protein GE061_015748 [Apolygus lucorum]
MMPLAPTPVMAVPSKPKIGFSIDSIVGGSPEPEDDDSRHSASPKSSGSSSPLDPGRSPPPLLRPSALPPMHHQHKGLYHMSHHEMGANQLALAAAAAQQFHAAGLAAALGPPHQGQPPFHHQQPPRDSYPLYPWLLSRHGRIFPHRFPGGPDIPGFLLQPFRKPKRNPDSLPTPPSQLLKLEHAFEKNHYVVGA